MGEYRGFRVELFPDAFLNMAPQKGVEAAREQGFRWESLGIRGLDRDIPYKAP